MAKKYYAVRVGHNPGIYVTWSDCEVQVKGFPGAQYKSFPTEAEAKAYMGSIDLPKSAGIKPTRTDTKKTSASASKGMSVGEYLKTQTDNISQIVESDPCEIRAFIDGSFDKRKGVVGSGGVILLGAEEVEFSLSSTEPNHVAYWNVSGELLAALHVVDYALDHGYTSCSLYYDYMGIEMWATGRWKTNNPLTTNYAKRMKEASKKLRIDFHKVKAHSGIAYNDRADALAKKGTLLK
ncbi:viroplasmin family protein [Veillonella sp. 3627]|uniref:ribonuclease H1 domain-containing protein n=1 Tax=Veillonella sp. 3627 TaxID=2490953 RepID=UPI000F8D190B|nr:ribonuclease H family protein [Veillonella sp. 3627]